MARTTSIRGPADVVARPFEPGQAPPRWVPGDVILTHSPRGIFGRLIRFGQRLRYRSKHERPFAWFNHVAVVVTPDEDGRPRLVEALGKGVITTEADRYHPQWFAYIDTGASEHDRAKVVAYAERVAAMQPKYGVVQIVSIAWALLTGGRFTVGINGTEICSSFAAKSLRPAGYWWERVPGGRRARPRMLDESYLMPADLAVSFHTERIRRDAEPTERADDATG